MKTDMMRQDDKIDVDGRMINWQDVIAYGQNVGWMDIKCGIWQLHKTKTDMQASSEQLSKIMTHDGYDATWRTDDTLYDNGRIIQKQDVIFLWDGWT